MSYQYVYLAMSLMGSLSSSKTLHSRAMMESSLEVRVNGFTVVDLQGFVGTGQPLHVPWVELVPTYLLGRRLVHENYADIES